MIYIQICEPLYIDRFFRRVRLFQNQQKRQYQQRAAKRGVACRARADGLGSRALIASKHWAALRALATEYEEECRRERLPGSAAGLAAWIASQDKVRQPASPDPEAVQVLTVHRAKGLEWPLVVLAGVPSGINVFLIATQFGVGQRLGSSVVAMTTALGVLTSTGWLALLRAH